MKQAGERPRGSRTAIPQYLRSCQAPLHQHQQHPLEGRVPGVGASSDGRYPAKLSARQERTLVSPYATGLCSPGSPTLPSSPPVARHLPSPPVGRHSSSPAQRDDDHAPSKGQHSMMSPDRERHQSPLCTQHHQHHPQPQHHAYIVSYACVTPTHNGYDGGAGGRGGDTSSSHVHNSSSASFASSVSSTTASTSTTTTTTTATSLPSPMSLQDYPIRGTISPLSSQVGVPARRQGGGGGRDGDGPEEISFVFGRPDTPDAAVVGRCMSPPLSCGGGGSKRPLSPGSRDLLPIRRTLSASASTSLVVEREVMSPPPVSSSSSLWSWGEGQMLQGGVCCEHCNACLIDFKRQALRLMFPDTGNGPCLAQSVRLDGHGGQAGGARPREAAADQRSVPGVRDAGATAEAGGCDDAALHPVGTDSTQRARRQHPGARRLLQPRPAAQVHKTECSIRASGMPLAVQAQAYLEHNVRAYVNPKKYASMLAARAAGQADRHHVTDMAATADLGQRGQLHPHLSMAHVQPVAHGRPPLPASVYHTPSQSTCSSCPSRAMSPSPVSSPSSPPPNPAAISFFHRAAQKLSKKKKRQQSQEPEPPSYPTSYGHVIRLTPPPAPPCLLRTVGRLQNPGVGKVKVMVRVCTAGPGGQGEVGASFLSIDPRRKQVTIFDPSASGYVTAANRRAGIAAPKMFAFDAVFSPDDSLTELCAASLSEIVQAVVSGADGCLFTYGYSRTGKSYTMLGTDQSGQTMGVMPCAIAWLFKLINEQKDKTGARFSVRVSAVEVTGKNETLRDLLTDIAQGTEATGVGTAPGVYLREDPICGTQLENQSELRAPTADKAALYLDAALAARLAADEDEARSSHLLFTLNVYQYRIEKANKAGLPGVAGGRSRLHLIDLGSASKSKDPNNVSLSLSALGNVIMALLNGQRHVPHRDSKISQLLRDSLGNLTCRTCMLAHVSSAVPHYNETLQVIQLAARIHRMKRRRIKFSSTSSEDSSTDESAKFRRPYRGLRMGTLREDVLYSSSHSDPDYTSSSEQSCDTVIYLGANGQSLSDRELTDNEGPPRHVPRTNPRLPRRPSGSRSSGDDSDSGRSRASDGRMPAAVGDPRSPCAVAGSPSAAVRGPGVQHPISAPGSPSPSHVKLAHRMNLQGKSLGPRTPLASEVRDANAHWQDKMVKQHAQRVKAASELGPIEGEQWIDGPGAAIYPDPKTASEQWVDGPPAFIVQNEQQQQQQQQQQQVSSQPQSPQHRGDTARRLKNRKVDAEEQWVDGPREMMAGVGGAGGSTTPLHTTKHATAASAAAPNGKGGQSSQANKLSMGVSERALKQALIKHLEKERPESGGSVDSNLSTAAEAADSRPSSMVSSGEGARVVDPACQKTDQGLYMGRGVKDWGHGQRRAGDGVSVVDGEDAGNTNGLRSDVDSYGGELSSPSHHKKHYKDHAGKKLHSSPRHSPKASPACLRKVKADGSKSSRLQKSELPGSASPTQRVAQWIKSVSSSDAPSGQDVSQGPENPSLHDVLMADAETNTEHDSDFERMADSTGTRSDDDGPKDVSNVNSSVDSSDAHERGSEGRQESIYEVTVEEQLEGLKSHKDGNRLAAEVDDETFSSPSCSAREAEDTDREESALVQHSKVLTEGRQSSQLAKHLAAHTFHTSSNLCPGLEPSFTSDISKPLLSRKPDGASNPHLNREFSEEDIVAKDHFLRNKSCLEPHYSTVCHTDTADVYTASGHYISEAGGVCDGLDSGSPSLSGKGSKFAIHSKPPLPQKSAPSSLSSSPKINGHQKPSSMSSSCTSSGPLAPSSATSTPKSVSSKESPVLHKQNSLKSSPVPVNIPGHSGRKDKEKGGKVGKEKLSANGASPPTAAKNNGQKGGKSHSKLPLFSSRASTPTVGGKEGKDSKTMRKKEKETAKSVRCMNGKLVEINPHYHKARGANNDSDSGNDSGIVAREKRLLSPYATVTQPRTPSHSSSGHGSDNSSTVSTDIHSHPGSKGDKLHGGTSSGYESMLRESEGTASSDDHDDSESENSEKKKGSKRKGTKRSRSAPARSSESPGSNGGGSNGSRGWHKGKDEAVELKKYDLEDMERLQRRRPEDAEPRTSDSRRGKEHQGKQPFEEGGKPEVIEAKDRISMERGGWGFDCKFLMCFCKSRSRATDV
ncbi:kinesin-like protein KIF26A isoform X2 [Pomacea canaliculata]|nr:kinesin-like protein KIF26A isoform X2 [Pomacea canaliculata]XP_025104477.1 kinesin-like protein KIF26A isoform X2 [Pomacea canaliculata]